MSSRNNSKVRENYKEARKGFTLDLTDLYYVWEEVTIDVNSVFLQELEKPIGKIEF